MYLLRPVAFRFHFGQCLQMLSLFPRDSIVQPAIDVDSSSLSPELEMAQRHVWRSITYGRTRVQNDSISVYHSISVSLPIGED